MVTPIEQEQVVKLAADAIRSADSLLITTGAGMGVDSGLPDFRGTEGFWRAYPAAKQLGLRFEQLANPSWFVRDPGLAWGFYGHRLNLYRQTVPHRGFSQLLEWCQRVQHYFVFTSNVDGHFQRAGFDERTIVECHGSIHYVQCVDPGCRPVEDGRQLAIEVDHASLRAREPLPRCDRCGQCLRPNICMFGDYGWLTDRVDAQLRRYTDWLNTIDARKLVVLEFGAGTAIATVRHESEQRAGTLIRVNPRESQVPFGGLSLAMGAVEAIDRIAHHLETCI